MKPVGEVLAINDVRELVVAGGHDQVGRSFRSPEGHVEFDEGPHLHGVIGACFMHSGFAGNVDVPAQLV